MELLELEAKTREKSGKGAARELRRNKAFPAIVYGAKTEPSMLSLDTATFDKIIRDHGTSGLFFNLKVDGGSGSDRIVLLKDLQMDTFGLNYFHADLQEVDMDKKVSVTVPVEAIGVCRGVKEGGLLQIIRRELELLCKPADTPDSVKIDITDLDVGDAIHVADIDPGDGIEIPHEVNFTVITIVAPSTGDKEVGDDEEESVEAVAAPKAKA
ncbi:MAG: 50S ribosomal protein L25 [Pseudomonadota bacterium]